MAYTYSVMKPAILLCFLLLAVPVHARLGELTQQIEARYGKPLEATKPESPATNAEVYEKNGFRITVGFYEGKSYYEQFQKVDPQKPNSFLEITETEREWLLNRNDQHVWSHFVKPLSQSQNGVAREEEVIYVSLNRQMQAIYGLKVFTIRSLQFEKQKGADEKKQLEENLKDF